MLQNLDSAYICFVHDDDAYACIYIDMISMFARDGFMCESYALYAYVHGLRFLPYSNSMSTAAVSHFFNSCLLRTSMPYMDLQLYPKATFDTLLIMIRVRPLNSISASVRLNNRSHIYIYTFIYMHGIRICIRVRIRIQFYAYASIHMRQRRNKTLI